MKTITGEQLTNLINKYTNNNGVALNVREGVLTSGDWILYDPNNKLKCFVIKDVYLNAWSSTQSIRSYNKIPAKYQKIINAQ